MREVYRAGDITEAQIVAGMLESRGIAAHVSGFFLQGGVGELASQDFARVQVGDEDFDAARAVVTEYDAASPPTPARQRDAAGVSPGLIVVGVFLAVFGLAYWVMG